jgi:hypothetical protein
LKLVKREEIKPKIEVKPSEADLSPDWRNEPRSQPGFEHIFSQAQRPTSPYKKSSSRNFSAYSHKSTQPLVTILHPKPHAQSKPTTRASQDAPKADFALYTPPAQDSQQLAVVATAATLCGRRYKSTNFFAILPEVKS